MKKKMSLRNRLILALGGYVEQIKLPDTPCLVKQIRIEPIRIRACCSFVKGMPEERAKESLRFELAKGIMNEDCVSYYHKPSHFNFGIDDWCAEIEVLPRSESNETQGI